ncbi:methyltransferase [Actinoplanes sp. NPDC089786]|uniref:methyltransferase n=1 Tax=Actinoplanes sp. NPDC089786 TaxID=3155185 RepID=UPI00342CDC61
MTAALYPAVSRAVYALTALRVPDLLADGPLTLPEIAEKAGAQERPLRQVLRTAASTGLFRTTQPDTYELTDSGQHLCDGHPTFARDLVLTQGSPVFHASLGQIVDTLRTGRSGVDLTGSGDLFAYYGSHPEEFASFGRMMTAYLGDSPQAAARTYDFPGGGHVVDCGGGIGTQLRTVLEAHPGLTGTLFDLPAVIEQAPDPGLGERWTTAAGDFFQKVPGGGDFYLLSHILHDWDDEQAIAILRNCADAGAAGARVVVLEEIIPSGDGPDPAKMLDVVLASVFLGAERTVAEFEALFSAAGLTLSRVLPTGSTVTVIEAVASGLSEGVAQPTPSRTR